jgi:hypothetical protein
MAIVTPNQAHDFYRAAASFRSVVLDEPIKVESEQVESGPRFAIVLGKEAKTKGVRRPVPGHTRPPSARSGGLNSVAPTPGDWRSWKPAPG